MTDESDQTESTEPITEPEGTTINAQRIRALRAQRRRLAEMAQAIQSPKRVAAAKADLADVDRRLAALGWVEPGA